MKKLKNILFKIVIIYIILYIFLTSITTSYGRIYDEACGEYVSQYARDFIDKYGGNSRYNTGSGEIIWSGGSFGQGTFNAVCTSGVAYMFELALQVDISKLDYTMTSAINLTKLANSNYWEEIPLNSVQAGDVLVKNGHTELYIGNGETANFGNDPNSGTIDLMSYNNWQKAFRLKGVDVTPNGNVPAASTGTTEEISIYGSNGFVYQGLPESTGYASSGSIWEMILNALSEIVDWLLGILTYGIRVVIVGWTSIIERNIVSGIFNFVTGVENETETEPQAETQEDSTNQSTEENNEQTPLEELTDVNDPQYEDISYKNTITIENIVYNKVPFLDANFFNYDTAGGVPLKAGTVMYNIKYNIAIWYNLLRTISIAVMLVILIYLGVRLAFSSIAEQKAIYKNMLVGWAVGFVLIFLMHYIMFIILQINDSLLELLAPAAEIGTEYSLYESVRSKAYEIKASTGWAGTIMYIVLIYYAIRFMYVYLKRLFNIIILAVMSPLIGISFAIEKINKKGNSKGDIYSNWLKDFTRTVLMQSVHALIYTIFIQAILTLMEASLTGILISFVFLNFMLKAEKILSRIINMGDGTDVGKGIIPAAVKGAVTGGIVGGTAGKYYAKYLNDLAKPIKDIGRDAANLALRPFDKAYLNSSEYQSLKTKEERDEAYKTYKKERNKQIKTALSNTGSAIKTAGSAVLTIPGMIAEPEAGFVFLGQTISGYQGFQDRIRKLKGFNRPQKTKKYKLTSSSKMFKRRVQMERYLKWNGIRYKIDNGNIFILDINGNWKQLSIYKKLGKNIDDTIKKNEKIEFYDQDGEKIEEGRSVTSKIVNVTKALNGFTLVDDLMDMSKLLQKDINDKEEKVQLLNKALKKEDQLIETYKQGIEKNKIIKEDKWKSVLGQNIEKKQIDQFNETVKEIMEPIGFSDIKQAVENYKENSKEDVKTRMNKGIIENSDYRKIAEEINSILEKKGSDVRVEEDVFAENVKLAVEAVKKADSEKLVVEEAEKADNKQGKRERPNSSSYTDDKYTSQNRNAPQPNMGGSADGENNQGTFGQDIDNSRTGNNRNRRINQNNKSDNSEDRS